MASLYYSSIIKHCIYILTGSLDCWVQYGNWEDATYPLTTAQSLSALLVQSIIHYGQALSLTRDDSKILSGGSAFRRAIDIRDAALALLRYCCSCWQYNSSKMKNWILPSQRNGSFTVMVMQLFHGRIDMPWWRSRALDQEVRKGWEQTSQH